MCIVCLTGCSWLVIDNARYYNEVVATIGEKKFYKKDLVEAFSNYGYQYYEQYGYSIEESLNYTIGSMVDRWLLLEEVKKNKAYELTDEEELQIKKEAFDYMQDSIFTYEEKIRKEWDLTVDTEESATEAEPLRTAEEEYIPTTYYDPDNADAEGNVVFRVDNTDDTSVNVGELKITDHFNKSFQIVTDQKVSDEAWTRYVKALQDLAKGEGRSQKEADVLEHEEKRLIELLSNNKYLEKFEDDFYDNLAVDVESVLKYFKAQYKSQKDKYLADESLYHTAMQKASSEFVYFHPNSGNEYANVKHILINFTDSQKEQITALNTDFDVKDDGTDEDEEKKQNPIYQARLQDIVNETYTTFEMDGETKTWNALVSSGDNDSVLNYVYNYVNGATLKERASQFNELIYIFNDDPGIMNSEFDYVVNLDTTVQDQMVKPFADGVRALDKQVKEEGAVAPMSYCVSSYGIHILFHAGNVKNIVEEKNIDNISDAELLRLLCTTYTTPESNKTIFNYIYDTLALDEHAYDEKSEEAVRTARTALKNNGVEIVVYPKSYEDLWK